MRAYARDRASVRETVIENSQVGRAIVGLVASVRSWQGTQTELLRELNTDRRSDDQTRRSPEWPKSARKLASDLRRLASSLRAVGISIDIPNRRSGRGKHREIVIERRPAERSASAAPSAIAADDPENVALIRTIADHPIPDDAPQQSAPIGDSSPIPHIAACADHADRYSAQHSALETEPTPDAVVSDYAEAAGADEEVFDR